MADSHPADPVPPPAPSLVVQRQREIYLGGPEGERPPTAQRRRNWNGGLRRDASAAYVYVAVRGPGPRRPSAPTARFAACRIVPLMLRDVSPRLCVNARPAACRAQSPSWAPIGVHSMLHAEAEAGRVRGAARSLGVR